MSRRFEIGVGVLVLGAVGLLAYMALQIGAIRGLGEDPVEVVAIMDDVVGLSEGAVVAVAGVPVGRVASMTVDFDRARVGLSIDASAGVRNDARVVMRARSVLGEKYIELVPQTREAPLLKDGDELLHTEKTLEIDQLVTRMGPIIDAIDPKVLSRLTQALSASLDEDPERPARMLADLERALHNLAQASDQLDPTLAETRATLTSVRRTSDAARPAIHKLEASVERVDELLAAVPPEQVPALLDDLSAAVADGRAVLVRLDRVSGTVEELVTKANSFDREDWLRITQEEGVLIRIKRRDVDAVLAAEAREGE
jgi:phospholipid/cholesterol/gamma-HCH transport system substrate-binding protein